MGFKRSYMLLMPVWRVIADRYMGFKRLCQDWVVFAWVLRWFLLKPMQIATRHTLHLLKPMQIAACPC